MYIQLKYHMVVYLCYVISQLPICDCHCSLIIASVLNVHIMYSVLCYCSILCHVILLLSISHYYCLLISATALIVHIMYPTHATIQCN
uniref:Uncharacterized protein n=1 Tax=Rhipicephalus pulchellus TaxID=72859 RepID=L7M159_RHIPC